MTVTYSLSVADTKLFGFAKLLWRWKGSIYKLMYRELLIFCFFYFCLGFLYRYGLDDQNKLIFAEISTYCQSFTKFIPLSFVLGFYVTIVVQRWWDQFKCIPWPDKCMMLVSSHLQGKDDRSRMMRRTIARYLVLLLTLTLQAVSSSVKKRFPTVDHLQEAGLLTNAERIAYDKIPETHTKWWVPAKWSACILTRARKEKRIKHDVLLKQALDALFEYRSSCGDIFCYDWVSIPLVYTQTVTIATYVYFIAAIMARQYIETPNSKGIDSYLPIFTFLEFMMEFLCYMGWLKVAEQLINPFGEDDDDFDLNWCLDRNLFIGLYIADEMHNQMPILMKDSFWNDEEPSLPYTKSSFNLRSKAHLGSAINVAVSEQEAEFVPLEPIMEDEKDDYVLNDITDNLTPEVNGMGYRFNYNYNMAKAADLDGVSVSTTNFRIPPNVPGHKFFNSISNMILGQSNETMNKPNVNDRYMYYNSKKNSQPDAQSVQTSQTSGFLQTPVHFSSMKNRNIRKPTITRSNTTSTNNSMTRQNKIKQRKSSFSNNSTGLKNADSSTAVSRISNEDLTSLRSEAMSFGNYKSSPITYRKYSFRGQIPADDQQSLINFEKFPELNQINSISSSAESNQPMFANSRFSVYKSQQPSPQPHQLAGQLNQKLAQLERNNSLNQYNENYGPNYPSLNYMSNYAQYQQQFNPNQPDDTISTVSTISGLQMNFSPQNLDSQNYLERSNSRANDIKVTIEDDKLVQPAAIFNINNSSTNTLFVPPTENSNIILPNSSSTATLKESINQMPIIAPSKLDENINDQERINKEKQVLEPKETKELVTIVEETMEGSSISSQNDVKSISDEKSSTKIKENENSTKEERKLDKKLSVDLIYEPNGNSSQESLSPFQSNQNTVTSYMDFINKAEEKGDDN